MEHLGISPYEPYAITFDILNGNKVERSVELLLNNFLSDGMKTEKIQLSD